MAQSGPRSPSTIVDNPNIGTVTWNFPENAVSSNNLYAEADLEQNLTSHYLQATNFGFTISAGAIINGIVVEIERMENDALDNIFDNAIRIVRGGTIGSTDKSSATEWGIDSDIYTSYGSSTDLWGETWTANQINSSNFGVAISAKAVNGLIFTAAEVDHIRITVYYTETGSTTTSTSSSTTTTTSTSSSTSTSTTSTSTSTSTTSTSTSTSTTSTSTTSTSTSTTTTFPLHGNFRIENPPQK